MGNPLNFDDQQKYIEIIRHWNEEKQKETGTPVYYHTRTYGCQQNVSDGEKIGGMLTEMGYLPVSRPEDADLVIYNTCAIRENAEERVFGNVGALKHAKRRNPDMLVGLCGCMMQQQHIADKIRKSYPYVDLVFGTHALARLPELLYRQKTEGVRVFETSDAKGDIVEGLPLQRDGNIKAWLPIMYGCDNYCTYCVVPFVRGRERSRKPEHILAEARDLVARGYKEITLLGQNVNSYGKNLAQPISFAGLLEQICEIQGDFRIRFMTSHPKDCTRELIDTIARNDKICNHIHLPVQSGSDRILSAMNRKYTTAAYLELIEYAKETIPEVSFTSDIIVGFPGETEEDFDRTLELVRKVKYHSLFTFLFSKRQGTKAAEMEDLTPDEVKTARFNRLLAAQQELGAERYGELVGKAVRVLAEGPGKGGEDMLTGRTESNVIVNFRAPADRIGEFVTVKITQAMNWAVLGDVITL